jgi:hypothetical protein
MLWYQALAIAVAVAIMLIVAFVALGFLLQKGGR